MQQPCPESSLPQDSTQSTASCQSKLQPDAAQRQTPAAGGCKCHDMADALTCTGMLALVRGALRLDPPTGR